MDKATVTLATAADTQKPTAAPQFDATLVGRKQMQSLHNFQIIS